MLALSIIAVVTLTSCVSSLQPLVTYNTATTDDRITGSWIKDGQDYVVQKFLESDFYKNNKEEIKKDNKDNNHQLSEKEKKDSILYSKSYMISYIEKGVKYNLFGSLIRLNDELFINFTGVDLNKIESNDKLVEINLGDRLNTGTIAKVRFDNANSVRLDFIDGGFLYDQVKAGRMKIKYESDELYDTFVITASTAELQQFIEKYSNDSRFFNKENSVTLNRKS